MPVWGYNEKHYLKFSDKRLCEHSINRFNEDEKNGIENIVLKKVMPYIMELRFQE